MSDHLIVIPAFDEAATVGAVVTRARRHGAVLVVDDGSSDDTAARAAAAGADVLRLGARHGKGEALRRGFAEALARGVDRVVTLDGDGQHDPDEIPALLAASDAAPGALVIGGRLGGGGLAVMTPGRRAAALVAGFFLDWLTGEPLRDTQSGFRVYPADLLRTVALTRGGFVLESEALLRAAAAGRRVCEAPVAAIAVHGRRSRFRPAVDGLAVGAFLGRHVLRRLAAEGVFAARALGRPFTAARRRARHRELAEALVPHAGHPAALAVAVGSFTLARTVDTWSRWLRDPRARALARVGAAVAATPAMLGLALAQGLLGRLGLDLVTPLARRLYAPERLAAHLPGARAASGGGGAGDADVLVIGGGPGGATAATFLARRGLAVTVVEREAFPRFHIGESLLPANVPLFERLGVLPRLREAGFIVKHGAGFHDQETDREFTFRFLPGQPWPPWAFEVPRAEFDRILLDHARAEPGVSVLQPAGVEEVTLDAAGVTARVATGAGPRTLRARFLVDATGRDAFLATRTGRRRPMPGLGKVALFAHFRGAERLRGQDEGNIRIFTFDEGWFWLIPFTGDTASLGCVLHARSAREREASVEALYEAMIARCPRVARAVARATRITPVHSAANFSYDVAPIAGDRFVCVGDAMAFIDPIFSTGVFVAMQSAELAAAEIAAAFGDGRFEARRFRRYERTVRRGTARFARFIRHFYDPAFTEVFLSPRPAVGMLAAVTGVLAGGAFLRVPLRMRASLAVFFAIVRVVRWQRRRAGRSVESRLEW